jgi:hypothetical protein
MSDDGKARHRREFDQVSPTRCRQETFVVRTIALLLLLPGAFFAAWLVGREHKSHQRAESRTLVARLADAEERVYGRTGAYTDDVERLVGEARAHDLARKHGIDAYAGPDVFEVTVYAARYGGHDSYTIALADGVLRRSCAGVCD